MAPFQGAMIKEKELSVNHLDPFSRLDVSSDNSQDDLEEVIHDPEGDVWEDEFAANTTLGCLQSKHTPVIDDVDRITTILVL